MYRWKNRGILAVIFMVVGALIGYGYYHFYGCTTNCAISSDPTRTMIYFAGIGLIASIIFWGDKKEKELRLKIQGMSCYVSEDRIQTGFGYLTGIITCESNCQTGEFRCVYDPRKVSKKDIVKRLQEMEFTIDRIQK